jgi:hypothetical protein
VDLIEAGAAAVVLEAPRVIAGVVLDIGLPVVAGGVVAAPAGERNAHHLRQWVVAPRVDAVDIGTDRMDTAVEPSKIAINSPFGGDDTRFLKLSVDLGGSSTRFL